MSDSRRSSDAQKDPKLKASDYAEKAKEISKKMTATRKLSQEFAKKVADDDDLKEDKQYDLNELEAEIKKRAHDLAKYREKAIKKREKESKKLDKMLDKVVVGSKKLVREDEYESDTERNLVDELEALKFDAKRLADDIAREQRQNVEYAEITEHELLRAEEEATHAAIELSQRQREDWFEIENRLRDLSINKDLAVRQVKALGGKVKMLREDLQEKRENLESYRRDAIAAEETAMKLRNELHILENEMKTLLQNENDAHIWLEELRRKETRVRLLQEDDEEIDEEIGSAINVIKDIANKKLATEEKLRKLCQRKSDAAKWAEYLQSKVEREILVIHTNEQLLADTEAELEDADEALREISLQKKLAKADAVEFRDKAAEATAKAKKLAEMIKKERRGAQATLQNIVGDEREAIKEAFNLGKQCGSVKQYANNPTPPPAIY